MFVNGRQFELALQISVSRSTVHACMHYILYMWSVVGSNPTRGSSGKSLAALGVSICLASSFICIYIRNSTSTLSFPCLCNLSLSLSFTSLTLSLFPLSLSLSLSPQDLIDESPEEKMSRRNTVLRKFAFHQFTQYKFKESLENYLKIKEGTTLHYTQSPRSPPSLPPSLSLSLLSPSPSPLTLC